MSWNRRQFFSSLKALWRRLRPSYRYPILAGSVVVVALVILLFPRVSHAELISFTDIGNGIIYGVSQILFKFATWMIGMTVFFLRIFIEFASYNGYIDAPTVVVGWYMVRDLANMFFVVALLAIAFGTILGLESYEWKKALVKLVLAAIFINFSRLIIQVLIDASHVFTLTFINAVQGAAGGNVIQMLKLEKVLQIARIGGDSSLASASANEGILLEVLGAALAGLVFSLVAFVAMGAYALVMGVRVVILWILMILSPLAFIFSAIPQTKKYAEEFWQEVIKYIIVAPMMAFFLWLAFATMGNGDINTHVGIPPGFGTQFDQQQTLELFGSPRSALNEISTWENMSGFIVGVLFLFLGLERVGKVGVVGGSLVTSAYQLGKKAAYVASGYAAGRWLAGRSKDAGLKGLKAVGKGVGLAAYHISPAASWVKRSKQFGERQWQIFEGWRNAPGGKTIKVQKNADGSVKLDKNGKAQADRDKDGKLQYEDVELGFFQKQFQRRVIAEASTEKKLEKAKKFSEVRKESLKKDIKAVPEGWLTRDHEKVDALDRFEQGKMEGKSARSAAKTKEYSSAGKGAELSTMREQLEAGFLGVKKNPDKGLTTQEEIAKHERGSAAYEAETKKKAAEAKVSVTIDPKKSQNDGKPLLGLVQSTIADTRAAHLLDEKNKKIEKQQERQFLKSGHGQDELREEAALKKKIAFLEQDIKTRESQYGAEFAESAEGRNLQTQLAELKKFSDQGEGRIKAVEAESGRVFAEGATGRTLAEQQAAIKKRTELGEGGIKAEEAEASRRFAEDATEQLEEEARLTMRATTAQDATKRLGNERRLHLVKTDAAEFQDLVNEQSLGKITTDEQGSREKSKLNQVMSEIMRQALRDEELAQTYLASAEVAGISLDQKEELEERARTLRQTSRAWQYAASLAEQGNTGTDFSVSHNTLLSDVEQIEVHGKRGIKMPTRALTQPIEKSAKDSEEMNYKLFVKNLGNNLRLMRDKRTAGDTVTDADKAAMAGLMLHGVKNGWIDDAIGRYMDPDLVNDMQNTVGWTDTEFNPEKINDLMALFASGGNLGFARTHNTIGKMMDYATTNLKMPDGKDMDIDHFFQKLETNDFDNSELVAMQTGAGIDVVRFQEALADRENYIRELEANQAQIQIITGLRDKVATSGHPENGGHGETVTRANGRSLGILTGSAIAHESTYRESAKAGVADRSRMQTHATANIDERSGFVTRTRRNDLAKIRDGITTSNDYRGTNPRFQLHMAGLSSGEHLEDYQDKTAGNRLLVTGRNAAGEEAGRQKWLKTWGDTQGEYGRIEAGGEKVTVDRSGQEVRLTAERAIRQETSDNVMNNVFADRMATNPQDFLISMAKSSGIEENTALRTGQMNMRIMVGGEEVDINNYNELVNYYNAGAFTNGTPRIGNARLANYNPSGKAAAGAPGGPGG